MSNGKNCFICRKCGYKNKPGDKRCRNCKLRFIGSKKK